MKTYSGLAIADYFISKLNEQGTPITNMGVLKMIYFAHGYAYENLSRKLITDPFYAWQWGPVEVKTYEAFKKYGGSLISSVSGDTTCDLNEIKADLTLTNYLDRLLPLAKADPFTLSDITHKEGSPWSSTSAYHAINDEVIKSYFSKQKTDE